VTSSDAEAQRAARRSQGGVARDLENPERRRVQLDDALKPADEPG